MLILLKMNGIKYINFKEFLLIILLNRYKCMNKNTKCKRKTEKCGAPIWNENACR